jgi:hypothetical protein
MHTQKVLQWTFGLTLIALLLSGYSRVHAQPRSGDWKAPADFGEMVFTVDSAGTRINKITFTFSNWKCGSVTHVSGSITIIKGGGLPISNRQFTLQASLSSNEQMTVNGTFNETGDQASGTWTAVIYGTTCSGNWGPATVVSVEKVASGIPERFVLAQNYPNPFNSSTTIQFALPIASHVSIKVYNELGVEVATLVDKHLPPGEYKTTWNAADIASGVYLYRIQAGDFVETKKMLVLK